MKNDNGALTPIAGVLKTSTMSECTLRGQTDDFITNYASLGFTNDGASSRGYLAGTTTYSKTADTDGYINIGTQTTGVSAGKTATLGYWVFINDMLVDGNGWTKTGTSGTTTQGFYGATVCKFKAGDVISIDCASVTNDATATVNIFYKEMEVS